MQAFANRVTFIYGRPICDVASLKRLISGWGKFGAWTGLSEWYCNTSCDQSNVSGLHKAFFYLSQNLISHYNVCFFLEVKILTFLPWAGADEVDKILICKVATISFITVFYFFYFSQNWLCEHRSLFSPTRRVSIPINNACVVKVESSACAVNKYMFTPLPPVANFVQKS